MTIGDSGVNSAELWYEIAHPATENEIRASEELWAWRDVEVELALLTHQATFDGELAGVREARSTTTTLTFEVGELTIEIEIDESRELTGQLLPPIAGEVSLVRPHDPARELRTDPVGVFRLPAGRRGPAQFVIRLDDGRRLHTEWTVF